MNNTPPTRLPRLALVQMEVVPGRPDRNVERMLEFIDDAAVSDLNITNQFWGDAFAARLRLDASRRVGFTEGETAEIAGLPASCVRIPLPGTGETAPHVEYCALDRGPLARYFGADVSIELTSYTPDAADISL